jgi:hypothetical protein
MLNDTCSAQMPDFDKKHFDCEGPLGLPMKDAQAKLLDSLLGALPTEDRTLSRIVTPKAPTEVMDGERADVSWISTEDVDREGEIVIARGMNDSHFKLNPIVTLQHDCCCPPVGKSLWRKRAKDGPLAGIKAKTQYPKRPDGWNDDEWRPDTVLQLIQAGMLQGKSVGFVHLKSHAPSSHEIAANPEMAQVSRIIDEWLLIEYACTFLPMNQSAPVEAVSKIAVKPEILQALGIAAPLRTCAATSLAAVRFTPESEIHGAIERRIAAFDFEAMACNAIADGIDRTRGRV